MWGFKGRQKCIKLLADLTSVGVSSTQSGLDICFESVDEKKRSELDYSEREGDGDGGAGEKKERKTKAEVDG